MVSSFAQAPFSSARKWSTVTFAEHGTWVLGAPGIVGQGLSASAAAAVAAHESAGRRVLLLGVATGPAHGAAPPGGLTTVALLVLAERIRDDAAATVRYLVDCRHRPLRLLTPWRRYLSPARLSRGRPTQPASLDVGLLAA